MNPRLSPRTEITIIAALVSYGIVCADGSACIEALEEIGEPEAAQSLRDILETGK